MILKQRVECGIKDYVAVFIKVATSDAQSADAVSNAFYKTSDLIISDWIKISESRNVTVSGVNTVDRDDV